MLPSYFEMLFYEPLCSRPDAKLLTGTLTQPLDSSEALFLYPCGSVTVNDSPKFPQLVKN